MTIDDIKQLLFSEEMKDQIRTVVREEIELKTREVVREELEAEFDRRTNDIIYQLNMLRLELNEKINTLDDRLKNVEIDIKKIHKELTSIHTDINIVIKSFNQDDIKTAKRVEKIEKQLGIPYMI